MPACNGAIAARAPRSPTVSATETGAKLSSRGWQGGLSAIGALTLTSSGTPEHLGAGPSRAVYRDGLTLERLQEIATGAARNPARQLWLAQRFSPLSSPFRAGDGRLVAADGLAPISSLIERLLKALGVWEAALAAGMVSESCYDPGAMKFAGRNLAGRALDFANTSTLANLVEEAFARKAAARNGSGSCAARACRAFAVQSWDEWKQDPAAHRGRYLRRGARQRLRRRSGDRPGSRARSRIPRSRPRRHVDALPARVRLRRARRSAPQHADRPRSL